MAMAVADIKNGFMAGHLDGGIVGADFAAPAA
jgi:hypothetical protein